MKGMIKYILLIVGIAAVVFGLTGCSVNKQFVSACQDSWGVIGPEYRGYVQEDANISEDTKRIRLRTADNFDRLLLEASR